MPQYHVIKNYFSDKKIDAGLAPVFRIFLNQESIDYDEETLEAEFAEGSILSFPSDLRTSWDTLLRQKKDAEGFSVIAYALAGNISNERYRWLIDKLTIDIPSYISFSPSLIIVAATFGSTEFLQLLLDKGYQPSLNELKEGLFFSVYHGHQEIFDCLFSALNEKRRQNMESEFTLDMLRDDTGNTLLHIAVMGGVSTMIETMARSANLMTLLNNQGHRVIDEVVLSGNELLFKQFIHLHTICAIDINYSALLHTMAKSLVFSASQQMLLLSLRAYYIENTGLLDSLIREAIDAGNSQFVKVLLLELPNDYNLNDLLDYARRKECQEIIFLFGEEEQFRRWIVAVKSNIFERFSAYVDRKNKKQCEDLAKDDHVLKPYPLSTSVSTTEIKRKCDEKLQNFFYVSSYKALKEIYREISLEQRGNIASFTQSMILKRQTLSAAIKRGDDRAIQQQLLHAICGMNSVASEQTIVDDTCFLEEMSEVAESNVGIFDENVRRYTHKTHLFIETFAEEFDKTYRFYMCLSTGELLKKPDGVDQLAEVAKKAAGILPNVSVSAAALGIPLPLSIDFPSSVAVVAIIDLCLYFRDQHQQSRAGRIGHFFSATTLRDRTDIIYDAAEAMANQFYDQIEVLDNMKEGIPYVASMMVVRLFEYMVKCDENIQSSGRSRLLTLFRKLISNVINVGPEPEIIHKSLARAANDALSVQEHLVFYKNNAEERPLQLDQLYRDPTKSDPNKQWTVKGIFEHTGIRSEEGITYAGRGQNVQKYGYMNATTEEARYRGMTPSQTISWVSSWPTQQIGCAAAVSDRAHQNKKPYFSSPFGFLYTKKSPDGSKAKSGGLGYNY